MKSSFRSCVLMGAAIVVGCSNSSPATSGEKTPPQTAESNAVAEVEHPLLQPFRDCDECPSMVRVPSMPGSDQPLYVAQYELTWAEYHPAIKEANCPLPKLPKVERRYNYNLLSDNRPLTYLIPTEFECYLRWISKKTGRHYRLPTSEEWQHVAKADSEERYSWGDELGYNNAAVYGHYDEKYFSQNPIRKDARLYTTVEVGLFPANNWMLYDIIGNVREYVADFRRYPKCKPVHDQHLCRQIAMRGGRVGGPILSSPDGYDANKEDDLLHKIVWTPVFNYAPNNGYRLIRD